jgi:hypothetical protein
MDGLVPVNLDAKFTTARLPRFMRATFRSTSRNASVRELMYTLRIFVARKSIPRQSCGFLRLFHP